MIPISQQAPTTIVAILSSELSEAASYLEHWLRIMKQDNRAIFTAASEAQKPLTTASRTARRCNSPRSRFTCRALRSPTECRLTRHYNGSPTKAPGRYDEPRRDQAQSRLEISPLAAGADWTISESSGHALRRSRAPDAVLHERRETLPLPRAILPRVLGSGIRDLRNKPEKAP